MAKKPRLPIAGKLEKEKKPFARAVSTARSFGKEIRESAFISSEPQGKGNNWASVLETL
jgi:hypothetical protein